MIKKRPIDPKREALIVSYDYKSDVSDKFPIDIKKLALEISKYEIDPIVDIKKINVKDFHAGLYKLKRKKGWAILYSSSLDKQRLNFSLTHEVGHYFLHRKQSLEFECKITDVEFLNPEYKQQEIEADSFVSSLLIPDSSFLNFIRGKTVSKEFFITCCEKYDVSLTAVLLKWIRLTFLNAVLLVVRENFVLWGRSSTSSYSNGLFVKSNSKLDSVKEVLANNSYKKSISFGTDTSKIKLILFYKSYR